MVAYAGSDASERGLDEAAALLAPRPALVVAVWEPGAGFEMLEAPAAGEGMPAVPLDIRAAVETDAALYERAQRLVRPGCLPQPSSRPAAGPSPFVGLLTFPWVVSVG